MNVKRRSDCPCPQHKLRSQQFKGDTSLPFFSYGIFQPGELAFLGIKQHVGSFYAGKITGKLLIRDGMPILDTNEKNEQTRGFLLNFTPAFQKDAYAQIDALEPENHYRWGTAMVSGQNANVLYGKSPSKGSKVLDDAFWEGSKDPLFVEAIEVIDYTIRQFGDQRYSASTDPIFNLFQLQMAYLLLWSAIERYVTFRYNMHGLAILRTIKKLATDETFVKSLARNVGRKAEVVRSDDPEKTHKLDSTNPEKCIEYYYQLRCNITHRGKAFHDDYDLILSALRELLRIFSETKDSAFRESAEIRDTQAMRDVLQRPA